MAGLEGAALLTETRPLLILALVLIIGLTPIAVKVPGRGASVASPTGAPLVLRQRTQTTITGRGELKAASTTAR